MPSLEEQFEQAFTEITLDDSSRHLLEAEVVTDCVVSGETVTVTLDLPKDDALRRNISGSNASASFGEKMSIGFK